MHGIRRLVPVVAWILATSILAALGYRVLGSAGVIGAVVAMVLITARLRTREDGCREGRPGKP